MRPSFHSRLINGPFHDPGLLVSWAFHKRAVLFDLGDLGTLPPGDILKISHIFVSHTHMDHFVGFDHFVRLMLGRPRGISLFGPPGFLENVAGKMRGYTWNLVQNYTEFLVLNVYEVRPDRLLHRTFSCRSGFQPEHATDRPLEDAILCRDPAFTITAATLDHAVPCLAFALQEPFHINILKPALEKRGLPTGPWISHFKAQLYDKADPATRIQVPSIDGAGIHTYALGDLAADITTLTRGQKIAYVADAAYSPENVRKIVDLAYESDHLFIEAAFLHADREIAKAKYHLTARQAGRIARQAHAKRLTVFHFSPRYLDHGAALESEAREAFESRG
jgi:ribonuclease Z